MAVYSPRLIRSPIGPIRECHANKNFLLLLFSAFLAMSAVSLATELPIAPKGNAWVNCAETKSAFLKPDGWFFKKGKQDDIHGYFVTVGKKDGRSTREFLWSG